MDIHKIPLNVVAPASGAVLEAPPVLLASEHSVDYTCGRCGTVVLHDFDLSADALAAGGNGSPYK